MFGIGLPEMILILALALIVVGPDKLPDLARSAAKALMDLKKTAEGLKQSLTEEGNPLDEIRPDLEEAAKNLKENLLDTPPYQRPEKIVDLEQDSDNPAAKAYQELIRNNGDAIDSTQVEESATLSSPVTEDSTEQTSPKDQS